MSERIDDIEDVHNRMEHIEECEKAASSYKSILDDLAARKPKEFSVLMHQKYEVDPWFSSDGSIGGFVVSSNGKQVYGYDHSLADTINNIARNKKNACVR